MTAHGSSTASHRKIEAVVDDLLWPTEPGGIASPDPEASICHRATAEVLCRLPEEPYRKLADAGDTFAWFIPHADCGARVAPLTILSRR